ncbi:hypothetical protein ACLUUI_01420 [Enterobacterales bacterium AW_CKDN230030176-1A_HGKHYDSX7]
MKILVVSDGYPDNYWLSYNWGANPDHLIFLERRRVDDILGPLIFDLKGRVSLEAFNRYDYFSSDGPDVISERFANMLRQRCGSEVQLIAAIINLNGSARSGYYVMNILNAGKAFDMERCVYRPLLAALPEGPKKFKRIRLLENQPRFDIFRAEEHNPSIVLSDELAQMLSGARIKGVEFYNELDNM